MRLHTHLIVSGTAATVALAVAALSIGCVSVPVQRSALTPGIARPIRTMSVDGTVEMGASIAVADVETHDRPPGTSASGGPVPLSTSRQDDPGLHIPNLEASMYARFRVREGLSIGAHAGLAHLGLSTPTIDALHDPVDSVAFNIGPEVAYARRIGRTPVSAAFGASLSVATVPWAELYGDPDFVEPTLDTGTDIALLFHVAAALQFHLAEGFILEGGAAFQNHLQNIAFAEEVPDNDGDLTWDAWGFVPYATIRYVSPSGFLASAQLLVLTGFDRIDVEPVAGAFTVGFQLDHQEPTDVSTLGGG